MLRHARLVAVALLGAILTLGIVACASDSVGELSTPAMTLPATPDPEFTATAPPTLDEIDSGAWAVRVLGNDPMPTSGILRPDRTLAPVDVTEKSGSWRATISCAADGAATVTATLTVGGASTTTQIVCAESAAAEPDRVTIDFEGGKPTLLGFVTTAAAIFAVQLSER